MNHPALVRSGKSGPGRPAYPSVGSYSIDTGHHPDLDDNGIRYKQILLDRRKQRRLFPRAEHLQDGRRGVFPVNGDGESMTGPGTTEVMPGPSNSPTRESTVTCAGTAR